MELNWTHNRELRELTCIINDRLWYTSINGGNTIIKHYFEADICNQTILELTISGILVIDNIRDPVTNPSCTDIVSHAISSIVNPFSISRTVEIALVLNHTLSESSVENETRASILHLFETSSLSFLTPNYNSRATFTRCQSKQLISTRNIF